MRRFWWWPRTRASSRRPSNIWTSPACWAIVAVTKTDLVTRPEAEAVAAAAVALTEAAGLKVGATVLTSVHRGDGVAALVDALATVVPEHADGDGDGFPYNS